MTDAPGRDFPRFAQERLRPAVDAVQAGKKSALRLALIVAVLLFVVFAVTVYFFLAPYRQMLGESGITYWPLLFLAPLSLAMVGFSIAYILGLRQAVKEFRETLVGRLGEYIDPGLAYAANKPFSLPELEASLFFVGLGAPVSGRDCFQGGAGAAEVAFSDVVVKPGGAASADARPWTFLTGLFFTARYPRRFKSVWIDLPASVSASLGGIGAKLRELGDYSAELLRLDDNIDLRQTVVPAADNTLAGRVLSSGMRKKLHALRLAKGVEVFLSCRSDRLYIAILSAREKADASGVLEGFDIARCREFCDEAVLCMEVARGIGERGELFQE